MLNSVNLVDHLVHFTLKQYMEFARISDENEARERIEEFVKTFGIKKIDNDTYEIPMQHLSAIKMDRSLLMNSGLEWKCDCGTVNNVKNGEKCLKCDFTYKDWVFKQQEDHAKNQSIRYQPITNREVACFFFGKFVSMIQYQIPKNDNLEKRVQSANIAGSITFEFLAAMEKQYDKLRDGEIFDVTNQLGSPNNEILYNKIMKTLNLHLTQIDNS